MAIVLTSQDVRQLRKSLQTLLTPISHSSPEQWGLAVAENVMRLMRADQVFFALPFDGSVHVTGIGPRTADAARSYEADYWRLDHAIGEQRRAKGLEIHHQDDFYTPQDLRSDVLYNEWCCPNQLFDTLGMAIEVSSGPIPAGVNVYHSKATGRQFGARGRALMEILLPAFKSSIQSYHDSVRLRDSATDVIDILPVAACLVDLNGKIVHQNGRMTNLFGVQSVRTAICAVVQSMASEVAEASPRIDRPAFRSIATNKLKCEVRGVRFRTDAFPRITGIIFVSAILPADTMPPRLRELGRDRHLTRRECEVLPLIAQRLTVTEIAKTLGISPHTARHHTENIYLKLGVSSRHELADIIASS